ncbi:MAG: hypothetical protein GXO83_02735 [Chlorobi bacterium]|nr:hypothetical protein [Chlorobiota bacterium]
MNTKAITELLHESFHRRLGEQEKTVLEKALRENADLRAQKAEIEKLMKDFGEVSFSFRPGFAERVMNRIPGKTGKIIEVDFSGQLYTFFKRLVLTGVAAIILLLLSIYLTHGSLSKESVFGVQPMSDDNLVSYLLYEEE